MKIHRLINITRLSDGEHVGSLADSTDEDRIFSSLPAEICGEAAKAFHAGRDFPIRYSILGFQFTGRLVPAHLPAPRSHRLKPGTILHGKELAK